MPENNPRIRLCSVTPPISKAAMAPAVDGELHLHGGTESKTELYILPGSNLGVSLVPFTTACGGQKEN